MLALLMRHAGRVHAEQYLLFACSKCVHSVERLDLLYRVSGTSTTDGSGLERSSTYTVRLAMRFTKSTIDALCITSAAPLINVLAHVQRVLISRHVH